MTDREPSGARMFKDAKKDFSRKVRQIPLSFPFCADERGGFLDFPVILRWSLSCAQPKGSGHPWRDKVVEVVLLRHWKGMKL